jgi:hypothetical protein
MKLLETQKGALERKTPFNQLTLWSMSFAITGANVRLIFETTKHMANFSYVNDLLIFYFLLSFFDLPTIYECNRKVHIRR